MKAIALEIARVNVFAKDFYVIPFKLSLILVSHTFFSLSLFFSLSYFLSLSLFVFYIGRDFLCIYVCVFIRCVKLYEAVKKLVRVIDQCS